MWVVLLTALITFVASEFIGYVIHRLAHSPSAGRLYKAHMRHHLELYPPKQYFSDVYKSSGADSFVIWMAPIFILAVVGSFWLLPIKAAITVAVVMSAVSFVNTYVHDGLHVTNFWFSKFAWVQKLQLLHRKHHANMAIHYGIYLSSFDKLFGTFK